MTIWDNLVLVGYFVILIAIGVISARRVKQQEDFFLGGRSFGKLLQTFAAFGAGTGSSDPVNTGRTTFTSGMSGMWSVMYWLFVTPFYWITGVWYRRMRHLTLGDWFVERYESRALGAAYAVFGIGFFVLYGSMMFSAIGKVAAPLMNQDTVSILGTAYKIEYLLVPIIGVMVLAYGVIGGLRAAYFTDLIQGVCIIVLSVLLIPYGLEALVERFGNPETDSLVDGFTYLHQQLPAEHFSVVGSSSTSEFPLHRIIAIVIINLIGIVVQPHFIATGGGSAKTETNARIGLVVGNFLKRFCTVGWVLTALIALALFADNPDLVVDPERTWGVASRELLGPGLTGLMLACLLAALMSSIDAYMIVGSALVVRNIYAAYIEDDATEEQYVKIGRITGVFIVLGAVLISLFYMNAFQQLQLTWVFQILFAAPFWIGMYWRRATRAAAWITVIFNVLIFFAVPFAAPRLFPKLRTSEQFTQISDIVETTTVRAASPTDVAKRNAAIASWNARQLELAEATTAYQKAQSESHYATPTKLKELSAAAAALAKATRAAAAGELPEKLTVGEPYSVVTRTGGRGIFFPGGVVAVNDAGALQSHVKPEPVGDAIKISDSVTQQLFRYPEDTHLKGQGSLQLDYLLYTWAGIPLTDKTNAALDTLSLPPKIVMPFLVMILFSLVTRRNSEDALDQYYAKMKTPVDPDPEVDEQNLEAAYADPEVLEDLKLFPGSSWEFNRPTLMDVAGFITSLAICFGIIAMAVWVANIGS